MFKATETAIAANKAREVVKSKKFVVDIWFMTVV
jgi:hypothetical protein